MDEVAAEKAKAAGAVRKVEEMEKKVQDLQDMLEILTLDKETLGMDKEIAEERLEELESELLQLKQAAATASSSSAVPAVAAEAEVGSNEQVSEENERLRVAIKTLHDQYTDEKLHLSKQVRQLEKQVTALQPLEAIVSDLKASDAKQKQEISELKDMLDIANAYEAMVEDLTEKNLVLGDKVTELEASVATLESLREMSDEMEEQHAEYEAELRSSIEAKDMQLMEIQTVVAQHQAELDDKDRTIQQFRDLTQQNRTEIATLRSKISSEESQLAQLRARTHQNLATRVSLTHVRKRDTQFALQTLKLQQSDIELGHWKEFLPASIQASSQNNLQAHLQVVAARFKAKYLLSQVEVPSDLNLEAKMYQYSVMEALCRIIRSCGLALATLESRSTEPERFVTACHDCIARYTPVNAALDTSLTLFAEEGTLPLDSCNGLLALVKKETDDRKTTSDEIVSLKAQCHYTAALLVVRSEQMAQIRPDDQESTGRLVQLTKQIQQRVEDDLGPSETDHDDVLAVGGPTVTLFDTVLLAESAQALELCMTQDAKASACISELTGKLRDVHTALTKGVLMDELAAHVRAQPDKETRGIPPAKQMAAQLRHEFTSASTLDSRFKESVAQVERLSEQVRLLERNEKKQNVVREKMSKDVERLNDKLLVAETQLDQMNAQLIREREEFDTTLDRVHEEKDEVLNENRALKRQFKKIQDRSASASAKRSSRDSIDSSLSVLSAAGVTSEEMQALRHALRQSRETVKRLRKQLYTRDAQDIGGAAVADSISKVDEQKLIAYRKELRTLSEKIREYTYLPTLVSLKCPENPPEQQLLQQKLVKGQLVKKYNGLKAAIEKLYATAHPTRRAHTCFGDQSYLLSACAREMHTHTRIGKISIPSSSKNKSNDDVTAQHRVSLSREGLARLKNVAFAC